MVWYIMFALFVVVIAVMSFVHWINGDTSADTMIDEPFEDPVPKIYGIKYTSEKLMVYAAKGIGMEPMYLLYQDRFVRVGTHEYRLISSPDRDYVYVIPDRLMSERR